MDFPHHCIEPLASQLEKFHLHPSTRSDDPADTDTVEKGDMIERKSVDRRQQSAKMKLTVAKNNSKHTKPSLVDTYPCDTTVSIGVIKDSAPILTSKVTANTGYFSHSMVEGTYFSKFPNLVVELRLKIWGLALNVPQYPQIRLKDIKDADGNKTGHHELKNIKRNRIPALLHVCRESRAEALKHFQLCLGNNPTTFFHYAIDCPYFETMTIDQIPQILDALSPTDLLHMRQIRMKVHDWVDFDETEFRERFWRFAGLKSLILLLGDGSVDEKYQNVEATADCVRYDLKANKKNRPTGWKVPNIYVRVVRNFRHRDTGTSIQLRRW